MPAEPQNPALKDPGLHEELRAKGDSEQKAARLSNAVAREGAKAVGRRGGGAGSDDDGTVPELRRRAREWGLTGYSGTRRAELVRMLRDS